MKTRAVSPALKVQARIRPVTKISISEAIAQQIMDLIANGDLKPGQRLPSERELCKDFGAGRSSLREALRCLSIMGVLNARVGEGTSVALDGEKFLGKIVEWRLITEKHDIENLLEVRIAIEGIAAAKAASFAGEQEMARIDALIGRMKEAVDDAKRFAALDLEFHVTLAKASGNALLFDLVSMIRGQLARGLSKVLHVPDALPLSLKEHIAIVEAIRRGNPKAAEKAMQAHLSDALRRYEDAMEKQLPARRSAPRGGKSR
ncbi:MAG: GntR family transcriptional regulator [Acidobacteriales bacterium 59-55]|nr:FadR family transcriptional regulator [Terriglobales bacterium]OJV44627.1 MAG: GntR family transcriptional regulator [Acidobacteriales bacterium 59-55]